MKTKQPVIHVSAYYPPHLGGQENAVRDLARELTKADHRVEVLTSSQGGTAGSKTEEGVRVKRMRGFVFGHAPIMPWFPFALFRRAKPGSLVHLHIGQAFTPEIVWLLAKLRRFKYVAELHIDFEPSGPAGILLPLYKKYVLKRVLQSAAAIVTLNQKTLDTVREAYQCTGLARVLNNGIDEDFFNLRRTPLAPKPPRVLRLLFVGRLSKQKNIPTLLTALALTNRDVHLDIVGEGPEEAAIQNLIADLELSNVTLRGRLSRAEVMELYATCNALVMPSLYEAQPLVLLEAMAARIPVICTNVIGVKEHIGDGGIVVEPTSIGLADGIEHYYKHYDTLPQLVEKAYHKAEDMRWPPTLKRYETLYEEVLGA